MAHKVEYLSEDFEWFKSEREYEEYHISALEVGESTWAEQKYKTLVLYVDPDNGSVTTDIALYEKGLSHGND